MEKLQGILSDLQFFFSPLIKRIIDFTSLISGFSTTFTKKFLLYTLVIIFVLFFFQILKNKIKKKALNQKKQLIEVYDKILYFVSKAEHIEKQKGRNNINNSAIAIVQALVKNKDNPNYFNSKELFKLNIKKIEEKRGNKLISEENRNQINHRHTLIFNINMISKVITIAQILSIGGYIFFLS